MSQTPSVSSDIAAAEPSNSTTTRKKGGAPAEDVVITIDDYEIDEPLPKQPRRSNSSSMYEEEILNEINQLERPKGNAGTGSSGMSALSKSIFSQGISITTGISTSASEVQKITFGIVHSHFESMKKSSYFIGGNTNLHFPDVQISGTSGGDNVEGKFFSMIVPTKMTPESQKYRYFLRKGQLKIDNESMFELDDRMIDTIVKTAENVFFPYLKTINGQKYSKLEEIPKKPEYVILKETNDRSKLILRMDDISVQAGRSRIMPNFSIRVWEKNTRRNNWFMTKKGVTMSSFNFFYFVKGTLNVFTKHVHSIFSNFNELFNDIAAAYENSEESQDPFKNDSSSEVLPF